MVHVLQCITVFTASSSSVQASIAKPTHGQALTSACVTQESGAIKPLARQAKKGTFQVSSAAVPCQQSAGIAHSCRALSADRQEGTFARHAVDTVSKGYR